MLIPFSLLKLCKNIYMINLLNEAAAAKVDFNIIHNKLNSLPGFFVGSHLSDIAISKQCNQFVNLPMNNRTKSIPT